ncbi:hypothetical protein DL346_23075 [Paenibacillus montanisoli]|uniref:DNA-directed RNA polymerase subunit beta n=2 Tax=Paenibacillus montanisoli TaxID=2081970 RepID=A0A328TUS8_9BACL|nr:hypothetical protein DL346_23075 [Paenibacillus montanisoli]
MESVAQAERPNLLSSPPASKKQRQGGNNQPERESGVVKGKASVRKKRHPALRALLWTLRKSIVPILCVLALLGGMYAGYAVLGHRPGEEVFDLATWKHMYDLVFAD